MPRGVLLLGIGLDDAGCALALASLACGAASLFVEDTPSALRTAQREGCLTFTVSTVPEAVRILKNEVRKGIAVTVALRVSPEEAMSEMLRRGLQPDAVALGARMRSERSQAQAFQQRGADILGGFGLLPDGATVPLEQHCAAALEQSWTVAIDTAATLQQRRLQDRQLLVQAEERVLRGNHVAAFAAQWLRAAHSLQPRSLTRAFLQSTARTDTL